MIGAQGYYEYLAGHTAGMELNAYATRDIAGINKRTAACSRPLVYIKNKNECEGEKLAFLKVREKRFAK